MNNVLIHYGVKGMKWGVRHDEDKNSTSSRVAKDMKRDIDSFGFNNRIKKAREKDAKKNGIPKEAKNLSTGKHYDKALKIASDENSKMWEAKYKSDIDKLMDDSLKYNEKVLRTGKGDPAEYRELERRNQTILNNYYNDAMKTIDKHADELNAATLRDLGYDEDHVNAGVEYLRSKNKHIFDVYL